MKKILITGANSYVGTNVEKWLMKEPDKYYVETLDMKDPNWKEFDFSKFDIVFHVAGIAHVSTKKNMKELYFEVNRDLVIETAKKAKIEGIKQFIFMSSMIVYNSSETKITLETKPNPDNFYGQSKLEAEIGLLKLSNKSFNVCIVRPPIIYGPHSKGNFPKLLKLSQVLFLIPSYTNKKSMLFIYDFCKYVQILIDKNEKGIYFPRNVEPVCTNHLIELLRKINGKRTYKTSIFNWMIKIMIVKSNFFRKIWGDFYYDISDNNSQLIQTRLTDSIIITLKGKIENDSKL